MMVFSLLMAVCVAWPTAHQAGTEARSQQKPSSKAVAIEYTTHDFGPVTRGTVVSHTFNVRNDGAEALKIEAVDLQAPGMKTSFKPVITPGESVGITIEWNTAQLDGPMTGKAVVRFAEAKHPAVNLELRATVRRSIEILPMPAVFFSVYKGETATRSVTVVNHESRPLEIASVEPAGTHFTATITPVKPGEVYRLDVTVPRDAVTGRFMEAVYLNTNHPTLKRLKVGVNVFVKNELYVNPEVVELGQISLAELAANPQLVRLLDQKLIVRKRTGDFVIQSVSTNVPGLSVSTSSNDRAAAFQIDVSINRERLVAGRLAGVIRIETDDRRFPVLEVPVAGLVR